MKNRIKLILKIVAYLIALYLVWLETGYATVAVFASMMVYIEMNSMFNNFVIDYMKKQSNRIVVPKFKM